MEKAIIQGDHQLIIQQMEKANYYVTEIEEVLCLITNLTSKKTPDYPVPPK